MTFKSALLGATALLALPTMTFAADISFSEVPFAADDAAKRAVTASDKIVIDGTEYAIGYNILARTGDKIGTGTFGALVDETGAIVTEEDGSQALSVDADFTSFLPVGDKLYSITHFESRPGAMYLSELTQDADGKLTPVSTKPIEFKDLGGLWVPCAGSVTPWGTHLGSEEYPADAQGIEMATALEEIDDYYKPMVRFFGVDPAKMDLAQFRDVFNPYAYGYPTEITVSAAGEATAAKHYAMGRVAVELAYVMPDQKTAYISDDGTNVGLFKFVADEAGDLSAGTLYAAKWVQSSAENGGAAALEWVDLGHATDAEIAEAIAKKPAFSDIFEVADLGEGDTCGEGFGASNAEGVKQCLKVKPGMEAVASRIETRRYASMMGATTEFRKMEGITYNPDQHVLYLAMSEVAKGMEGGDKRDLASRDAIALPANKCGTVYELALDDAFSATEMKALISGMPHDYAEDAPEAGNSCDINGIANPDNITYMPGTNTLIIGEDTGSGHQNDVIWAMNLGSGDITRVFSTPYGSETTSPYFYPNIGGHAYLTAVVQHPYGESDEDKLQDAADARAYVGYIGPMPALDAK
ncbi:alkaline phosphatase [Rhodobacter sp. TJ_12]|uniref:PhoX family protein n=1 Tax=Rhodobacter sp. TJ_12 TaxID=2029399 RepID=UPI001CBC6E0D|nr:alkaline phosphatase PhoX [Rhodobacter sp. TJ_12]MBZ4023117.1 alkaline phosphatase [Rhodobacter sp. TJ_12]